MRREGARNALPATALVHEVFLRLVEVDGVSWQDRAHFFAVSANMMRRILVDRARAKGMMKRGGGALHVNLEDVPELALGSRSREIVAVDEKRWIPWLRLIQEKQRSSSSASSEGSALRKRQRC